MYQAIAYVSQISLSVSDKEIMELLENSQQNNIEKDISGVLLYSEGNFFQVIEGEEETINSLFEKIKADQRHENIILIFDRPINKAAMDGYKSDFITNRKRYESDPISEYLLHIRTLDPKSQAVVKSVIRNFVN